MAGGGGRKKRKILQIQNALLSSPVRVWELREHCLTEYGLVNNDLRQAVWPILLNVDPSAIPDHKELIQSHPDWNQVERDIERSLWKYTQHAPALLPVKRKELANIIHAVLSSQPTLKYFQGYHDIGSVLLMATNEKLAFALLEKLSLWHIRDALRPSLDYMIAYLGQLQPLLEWGDPAVARFLAASQVQPFFALSWVLTWFSHNIDDVAFAARLFDVFLSTSPLMPIYMSAAMIESIRGPLLLQECEYSAVHGFLVPAPSKILTSSYTSSGVTNKTEKDVHTQPTEIYSGKVLERIIFRSLQWYYLLPPRTLLAKSLVRLPADAIPWQFPFTWCKMGLMTTLKYKWFMFRQFSPKPLLSIFLYFMIIPVSIVVYRMYINKQ